jgi:hypothetical protein
MRPRLSRCEGCGATDTLQRHHPNREDYPALVVILCQACHTAADVELGLWGHGPKKVKTCTICGEQFTNYSHSRVKTCSRRCLSEAGRRNAAKRWHRGSLSPTSPASPTASPSASTDLGR